MGQSHLAGNDRRPDVDIDEGLDVFDRHIIEICKPDDSGVVHENIETAQFGDRFLYRRLHRRDISAVGLDGDALAALRLDRPDNFRGVIA